MAKIIGCLLLLFHVFADIFEIENLEEVLDFLDESTWVLIDEKECHLGLIAQGLPINGDTLKHLAMIGIDFTFNNLFSSNLESKAPIQWEGGVLFISDFNSKAKVFRKWLEMAQFRPSQIVIIDSGLTNLIEMEKEIEALKIPCQCLHYLKKP